MKHILNIHQNYLFVKKYSDQEDEYRNASNKRPGRLLNFSTFRGAFIRGGRLKEGGVYYKFYSSVYPVMFEILPRNQMVLTFS